MLAAHVLVGRIGWFEVLGELDRTLLVQSSLQKMLAAQALVCRIGWFEVLDILLGERCLDRTV